MQISMACPAVLCFVVRCLVRTKIDEDDGRPVLDGRGAYYLFSSTRGRAIMVWQEDAARCVDKDLVNDIANLACVFRELNKE